MNKHTIRIARSNKDLDGLLPFWTSQATRLENSPEYFRLILGLRDNILSPHVIVIETDSKPVALMLCRVEDVDLSSKFAYYTIAKHKIRSLTVIYNGLVGDITDTTISAMIGALQDALNKNEIDVVTVRGVAENSLLESALAAIKVPSWRRFVSSPETHRILALPKTFDNILAMRSSSNRKRLRRYSRRIEEIENFRYQVIDNTEDLNTLMADIETVAARTYQRGLGSGFYNNEEWEKILELGFDKGWLTLWMVYGDGKPLTYAGGFSYQGVFYSYLKGYDPDYGNFSVGTYLLLKMIEDLIERNVVHTLDYGFGDAPYKKLFSTNNWAERHHMIFARRLRPMAVALSVKIVHGASTTIQRIIRRHDLEARIKKFLRRQKSDS